MNKYFWFIFVQFTQRGQMGLFQLVTTLYNFLFPQERPPNARAHRWEATAHLFRTQMSFTQHCKTRRSGFTRLKKKVAAGWRLPSFFWRSHYHNGALEEIFCRLHINMKILIFCLMFPQHVHIWADLSALIKPAEKESTSLIGNKLLEYSRSTAYEYLCLL